jgi:hypothetical protein
MVGGKLLENAGLLHDKGRPALEMLQVGPWLTDLHGKATEVPKIWTENS